MVGTQENLSTSNGDVDKWRDSLVGKSLEL